MSVLNIKVVDSSANNPSSRGKIERVVGQVKILLKKLLATHESLNWELLPYLVSKLLNHTVTPRTGFKPVSMIFGNDNMSQCFLDHEPILPKHHLVQSAHLNIERLSAELTNMTNIARDKLIQLRTVTNERLNKNRISKLFSPNDIVFVIDRYELPGNTRPLKTKFFPSPFVVLRPLYTTCLVRRIADGFTALYSMDDLKKYSGADPAFSTLPPEISRILLHEFTDFLASDFTTITSFDPLLLPDSIQLFDTVDSKRPDDSSFSDLPLQGEGGIASLDPNDSELTKNSLDPQISSSLDPNASELTQNSLDPHVSPPPDQVSSDVIPDDDLTGLDDPDRVDDPPSYLHQDIEALHDSPIDYSNEDVETEVDVFPSSSLNKEDPTLSAPPSPPILRRSERKRVQFRQ